MSTSLRLRLVAAFGLIAPVALLAQNARSEAASADGIASTDQDSARAPYVIFSNLDRNPDDLYNSDPNFSLEIAGKKATGQTEKWGAIRFVPQDDVMAKVLSAAVHYESGTKLINLGVYSDNGNGTVGTLLPGGQGSTTEIADAGECCELATVTLAGDGVVLTAGTPYWLVVSPDNTNGATFSGGWQVANVADYASVIPPGAWQNFASQWLAGQIRGTRIPAGDAKKIAATASQAAAGRSIIFTNLDRASSNLYSAGSGIPVTGNSVVAFPELWQALPFTPRSDVHAKTLAAAVGYISGTKLINLGIYSDNAGGVGTPIVGGQGSTTDIPTLGDCCALTTVTLPGAGAALVGGTQYWLVASADDFNAPTFSGAWQPSSLAINAYREPENFIGWSSYSGVWLAAEIRGTSP